ncbi:hypothetical protein [Rhizorhapis suberifaciens]|uniref:Uncharacterized protein n=1 Tax=Rhizorhapis suberifaciens TaxID=13656 RepID=A0A840HV31_9SPHN|nr:hypothetical protein [Rhizorhapis suberifaciens]MBB4641447.1 hypothetical protein [Rhizorhapis suberifaciens]
MIPTIFTGEDDCVAVIAHPHAVHVDELDHALVQAVADAHIRAIV